MSAKKNAKTKKQSSKQTKRIGTAAAPANLDARAEAVEAMDGLDPEERAEAVEGLGDEGSADGNHTQTPEPMSEASPEITPETTPATAADATPIGTVDLPAPSAETAPDDVPAATVAPDAPPAPSETTIPDAPAPASAPASAPSNPDLEALRTDAIAAKAALDAAEADAKKIEEQAHAAVAKAKDRFRASLAPYRDACKAQKVACEFEGGARRPDVSERVAFEVALDGENIVIALKGKPETSERHPVEEVRTSINKTAYSYVDRHVGPRDVVGNKGGSLSNRLRAVLSKVGAPTA